MLLLYKFDKKDGILSALQLSFKSFLPFLQVDVMPSVLRHDGNKKDFIEIFKLTCRKCATFQTTLPSGFHETLASDACTHGQRSMNLKWILQAKAGGPKRMSVVTLLHQNLSNQQHVFSETLTQAISASIENTHCTKTEVLH